MKKKLKINFVDFWPDFNLDDNFFLNILQKYYDIEICEQPDLLFYSNFGFKHLNFTCKKIFYTGEYIEPNYNYCDYSFSFDENSEKNFHLPHFVEYDHFFNFKSQHFDKHIIHYRSSKKSNFCNFIASNEKANERIQFVKKLMKYRKVDCLGPVLYNMDEKKKIGKIQNGQYIDWRKEKLEIIKNYKFTVAFENMRAKNYVTEKIYQPLVVGSIPIYWGAPNIDEYFNPKCFINISKFKTFEEAIEEIIRIDNDRNLYNQFFSEPAILPNSKIFDITEELIVAKIKNLINEPTIPVSKKKRNLHKLKYIYKNLRQNIINLKQVFCND